MPSLSLTARAAGLLDRLPATLFMGAQELFLPLYHIVAEQPVAHGSYTRAFQTPASFAAQLDAWLQLFRPIGVEELLRAARGEATLPARSMLLTFDDGLREIGELVAPLLRRKGVPAVIFVSTSVLENQDLLFQHKASLIADHLRRRSRPQAEAELARRLDLANPTTEELCRSVLALGYRARARLDELAQLLELDVAAYCRERRPYLTVEELRGLAADGFVIGAHSVDHPKYAALSLQEQLEQTRASMQFVAETFAPPVRAFAFPFSDGGVSARFFREAAAQGLVDLTFGTAGLREDVPHSFQRVTLDKSTGDPSRIVSRIYAAQWLRRALRRNTLRRADA